MDKKEYKKAINELADSYELHLKQWAKRCIDTINEYTTNLQQENEKQKEVIDKAIEYINENKDKYYQDWGQDDSSVDTYLGEYEIKELLDILKEVSE